MTQHDSDDVAAIHRELHSHLPSEPALRTKALESLLVEKGMVDSATVDAWIDAYSENIGPKNGARIVARAWVDPDFAKRLLEDAGEAVKELGYEQEHLIAVANTPQVHNIVVCTLCSCYPTPLLGMPPNWYKMAAYRARTVRDPRGVLDEFGEGVPLKWTDDTGVSQPVPVTLASGEQIWIKVTENPTAGNTEEWELYNFTEDAHPIHLHLVRFEVVSREGLDGGPSIVGSAPQPWETGFKDTVIAYPGEVTTVKALFDVPGLYVWHCHIVEHEDNEMMRPFVVSE